MRIMRGRSMELFSLGEGHYTEKDVTEAARALTGWSLDRKRTDSFTARLFHDDGNKTFLGLTGNLDGDDMMAQIVRQPQADFSSPASCGIISPASRRRRN